MRKIAFLFSGQGAQYPGMMSDLCRELEPCKSIFALADEVLQRDISSICADGPQENLNITHNTQPCMLAADLAAWAAISHFGVKADAVAGFSLGEYAALVAAGVMDIADAFRVIQIRADAMQAAVPQGEGLMAAIIGAGAGVVEDACSQVESGYVAAANYNCPGQIVISGSTMAVREAISKVSGLGARAVELPVSAPFHCQLMAPAAKELGEALAKLHFSVPELPVYMNVDANVLKSADEVADKLIRQAVSPVLWQKTIENMYNAGIDTYVELGPGKTLSQFVKRTLKGVSIYRVEDEKTLHDTLEQLNA